MWWWKFAAVVTDVLVNARLFSACFLAAARAFLAPCELALGTPQVALSGAEVPRVSDSRAVT